MGAPLSDGRVQPCRRCVVSWRACARVRIVIASGLLCVGARACVSARGLPHALLSIETRAQRAVRQALVASCWAGARVRVVIVSGLFRTPPCMDMLVPCHTFIAAVAAHFYCARGFAITR